jgi:hypothetical protein
MQKTYRQLLEEAKAKEEKAKEDAEKAEKAHA